jgi:hypothetical protein
MAKAIRTSFRQFNLRTASPIIAQNALSPIGPWSRRCMFRPVGKVFSEWLWAFVQAAGIGRICGASAVSGPHNTVHAGSHRVFHSR